VFQKRSSDFYADPAFRQELIRLLLQDGIVPGKEAFLQRKDGSALYALGAAVLLTDERTGERYIQGVAVDITERKQAEEALRQSERAMRDLTATLESKVAQRTAELEHRARQLQKLTLELSEAEDQERKRLAEILHDDLQQVLAGAKFHVGLMRSQVKHDPALQALAAQIEHMLKDAIGKSRSLSHELSPAVMHHADFAETLRWLANEVQAKHGLVVHVQADGPVRAHSEVLKAFLYRAAQEMLFNVVKHSQVKEARIRVRRWGPYICLSVSDRGRGFDPKELREAIGFGLLSIRERIESLGGRMKIKSAKGRGSTFFMAAPNGEAAATGFAAEAESTGGAEEAEQPARADAGRLRVLLADDHEIVRQGLVSLLSEEHRVEIIGEAANGREAVDLADQLAPDVVIMDVSMPVVNGEEATRQIKTHRPQTRVVAFSMCEEPEVAERMHQAGAESYVLKTAPSEELLAAIRGQESNPAENPA
jgi:signal transduction histidine kinase/ActR/RegA family two-component response regulator